MAAAATPPDPTASSIRPLATQLRDEGRHEEALRTIGRHLRASSSSASALNAAARLCNELALSSMRDGEGEGYSLDAAFEYLQVSLGMRGTTRELQAVSLNNLSIFYSRTAQPQRALRCLLQARRRSGAPRRGPRRGAAEGSEDDIRVHVALNLTAVLADLGRHREALEMAHEAVEDLRRDAAERREAPQASLLSAAYHNLAVQQERS